ncbi:hypothetical protein QBC36DRAFT_16001 [Triangularia setosa]|uniref:Uncharacterized protein n=1 Tax=Triangularia setosa TaxID=2587417 RepID=A0AAN6W5U5_9PEZI|nr:hypothetical protein QBC36DRAFT_16001 [Podospora setosa]
MLLCPRGMPSSPPPSTGRAAQTRSSPNASPLPAHNFSPGWLSSMAMRLPAAESGEDKPGVPALSYLPESVCISVHCLLHLSDTPIQTSKRQPIYLVLPPNLSSLPQTCFSWVPFDMNQNRGVAQPPGRGMHLFLFGVMLGGSVVARRRNESHRFPLLAMCGRTAVHSFVSIVRHRTRICSQFPASLPGAGLGHHQDADLC